MTAEQTLPTIHPADLPLVTLDANPLIALLHGEPDAPAVQTLIDMNRARQIAIQVTVSTALEAGPPGQRFVWPDRLPWLESLGIAKNNIFVSPLSVGFAPQDEQGGVLYAPELEARLSERIHHILRPSMPHSWCAYRDREGAAACVSVEALADYDFASMHKFIPQTPQYPEMAKPSAYDLLSPEQQEIRQLHERLRRQWHNAKNDSSGLYIHLSRVQMTAYPERAVFVTTDKHFLRATVLPQLRALGLKGEILRPREAVAFLRQP